MAISFLCPRGELEFPPHISNIAVGPWDPPSPGGNMGFASFLIHGPGTQVLGQMQVIPSTYTPLSGTGYEDRDYWAWVGAPWPSVFRLVPGIPNNPPTSGWKACDASAFSNPASASPQGVLYKIERQVNGSWDLIGYLDKVGDDLHWYAEATALFQNHLPIVNAPGLRLTQIPSLLPGHDLSDFHVAHTPAKALP